MMERNNLREHKTKMKGHYEGAVLERDKEDSETVESERERMRRVRYNALFQQVVLLANRLCLLVT